MSIDNEELSSLLTTIRNQEREIEALNKEAESMRKNIEHFNEEHLLREKADAQPAPKAPAKRACKPKAEKTEKSEAKPKRTRKTKADAGEKSAE